VSELLVSVHIPKTGGVTFREWLEAWAGDRLVHDYADRPLAPEPAFARVRRRLARPSLPPGTRVVHGHFRASKYRRSHPDARLVTWFRDPIERLVSHYHYWQRVPDLDNATCRRLLDEKLSLVEFARIPEMRDVHSRFLDGVPVSAFAFVGLTEAYDESLRLFGRLFGLEPPSQSAQRNANPERGESGYVLDPADREALRALNQRDLELDAAARQRFDALGGVNES